MKINKYLVIFSGLLVFLATGSFFILTKFFPILVHHIFYRCQEMARTISLRLPGNLGTVVFGLLLVSVLYTAARLFATIINAYKFRRLLSRSVVKDYALSVASESLKLAGKVEVLSDDRPFAYCFGLRTPKIYITTGLLALVNEKELAVILRHEKYHLEHRDNLVLLFATLLTSLFPLFPVLKDLIRIYKTDRELLADNDAAHGSGNEDSLLSVLKKLLQYEPMAITALAPAIADTDTLEARIKSLLSIKVSYRNFSRINVFISVAFTVIFMTLLGTPVNAVELHEKDVDAMIVCSENVSCESVCKNRTLVSPDDVKPSYSSENSFTANK